MTTNGASIEDSATRDDADLRQSTSEYVRPTAIIVETTTGPTMTAKTTSVKTSMDWDRDEDKLYLGVCYSVVIAEVRMVVKDFLKEPDKNTDRDLSQVDREFIKPGLSTLYSLSLSAGFLASKKRISEVLAGKLSLRSSGRMASASLSSLIIVSQPRMR